MQLINLFPRQLLAALRRRTKAEDSYQPSAKLQAAIAAAEGKLRELPKAPPNRETRDGDPKARPCP